MMGSYAEHVGEAERLLELAEHHGGEQKDGYVQMAQAHATLAVAASIKEQDD